MSLEIDQCNPSVKTTMLYASTVLGYFEGNV